MLENKVVMVVGGGGLLGREICAGAAHAGATIVIADQRLDAAENVANALASEDAKTLALAIDITDAGSIDTAIAATGDSFGRLDGVVNTAYPRNARYGRRVEDVTYADFAENLSLHLGGYFLVAQRFALYFREQKAGSIVSLGSIYGTMAPRFEVYAGTDMTMPVEYAAIKAGIVQLTRYFAQAFKPDGVRVNAVSPGGIADGQPTEFLARYNAHAGAIGMLAPGDVVGSTNFLLSDAARAITGQNLIVDDGFSL